MESAMSPDARDFPCMSTFVMRTPLMYGYEGNQKSNRPAQPGKKGFTCDPNTSPMLYGRICPEFILLQQVQPLLHGVCTDAPQRWGRTNIPLPHAVSSRKGQRT